MALPEDEAPPVIVVVDDHAEIIATKKCCACAGSSAAAAAALEIDKATPNQEQQQQQESQLQPEKQARSFLMIDVVKDWALSLLIGCLVTTYWRGTWTLMDLWDCHGSADNQQQQQPLDANPIDGNLFCNALDVRSTSRRNSAWLSYGIGMVLLAVGVTLSWMGLWRPNHKNNNETEKKNQNPLQWRSSSDSLSAAVMTTETAQGKQDQNNQPMSSNGKNDNSSRKVIVITPYRAALRFTILYILGWATVQEWRGIWYLLDYYLWPDDPLASWWCTALVGAVGAFLLCTGASLLAPPAMFLLDGPGTNAPPIAVTLVSTFYDMKLPAHTKPPQLSWWMIGLDILVSFGMVPILVVSFWRGCWMLMDHYLWGFIADDDGNSAFNASLGYSLLIAVFCLGVASDDVFYFVPTMVHSNQLANQIVLRVRTLILAVGAVNWWRVVWYVWDQYLGHTSYWSASLAHVLGVVGLCSLGCLACICAPASTLGVDICACDDCSDEPLFSNVPVPAEALALFGIGRQPLAKTEREQQVDEKQNESYRQQAMERLQGLGGSTLHLNVSYCDVQRQGNRISRLEETAAMVSRLSKRNQLKRTKSPFFRNR